MENFIESSTLFWIMTALFFVGSAADMYMSRDLEYYGLNEGNRLTRDKYGNLNMKKAAIFTGVFYAIAFAVSFVTLPGAGLGMLAPVGIVRLLYGIIWTGKKKTNRKKQSAFLNKLRPFATHPIEDLNGVFKELGSLNGFGGRWYQQLFKFIYSTRADDLNQAAIEVRTELCRRSLLPESEWFKAFPAIK